MQRRRKLFDGIKREHKDSKSFESHFDDSNRFVFVIARLSSNQRTSSLQCLPILSAQFQFVRSVARHGQTQTHGLKEYCKTWIFFHQVSDTDFYATTPFFYIHSLFLFVPVQQMNFEQTGTYIVQFHQSKSCQCLGALASLCTINRAWQTIVCLRIYVIKLFESFFYPRS